MPIEPSQYADLAALVTTHDPDLKGEETPDTIYTGDLETALKTYFEGKENTYTVLGLDIYKYSGFTADRQRVVPFLFEHLFTTTKANCNHHESYLFQTDQFTSRFVPTGDGGFLILDTPLHVDVSPANESG